MNLRVTYFLLLLAILSQRLSLRAQDSPPTAYAVESILLRPNVWEATPLELASDLENLGFAWISVNRDVARSVLPGLNFQKHPLKEAILSFRDGRLAEARLIYFSRGDSGALRDEQFEALLGGITREVSGLTRREPTERGRDPGSAVKAEGRIWETGQTRYLLEWSATRGSHVRGIPFRAEFIRLVVSPGTTSPAPLGVATVTSRDVVKRFAGRDHVKRLAGGDVKVGDVPMVDQGQKGYCVVASVERVLRYYGANVDQHELAQMANSDSAAGTSVEAMLASLRALTARLGVKVRSLYEWNVRDYFKMLEDYNRATKRGKLAPQIKLSGPAFNVDGSYAQMKPELLKEARLKSSADFGKFKRDIQRSIDEGIPLLWSVRLGLVAEKEIRQAAGGHMRLIVGYNATTSEILYSDSWGLGHEEKRMAIDDAWAITMGLDTLQPVS